ncbi:Putative SOS response-associated peptidase YedK [Luteibacter sp. UNC138MFCol5.1]|uniref:SOS response-associated peptidase n=1 Tax=Luteibacter sp. UNC138MFCol5.1 TaxID=1502774 RepID=UPI0008D633B2|nr:SOS response-associated peptidase [Luteibacter sp. UNC138MFCol5.1]SEO76111.1 Putative SOS response-associated peptidase YedK [Luteibacter sp. UNC138MFCol5.1]
MCGRYATFGPVSLSREAREVLDQLELDIMSEIHLREDQFNIAPTQKALVVAHGRHGYEAKAFRWGLVPSWAKDLKLGAKTINARAETVATKPSFRNAFKKRRCLVPASGYFEWKGESPNKQPYFIHDPAGHLLMFAGLWEGWRASDAEDWSHTFTIITGEPGKVSGDIHDRQPVILPPDLWEVWMDGSPEDASATLAAAPEADLVYYPVPKAVGSPKNKGPELVRPVNL